jgi:hypothetical protein
MLDFLMQHAEKLTAFVEPGCSVLSLRVHTTRSTRLPLDHDEPPASVTVRQWEALDAVRAPRHGAQELPRLPAGELELLGRDRVDRDLTAAAGTRALGTGASVLVTPGGRAIGGRRLSAWAPHK